MLIIHFSFLIRSFSPYTINQRKVFHPVRTIWYTFPNWKKLICLCYILFCHFQLIYIIYQNYSFSFLERDFSNCVLESLVLHEKLMWFHERLKGKKCLLFNQLSITSALPLDKGFEELKNKIPEKLVSFTYVINIFFTFSYFNNAVG